MLCSLFLATFWSVQRLLIPLFSLFSLSLLPLLPLLILCFFFHCRFYLFFCCFASATCHNSLLFLELLLMVESHVRGRQQQRENRLDARRLPACLLARLASPACLHLHSVTVHSSNLIASHCIASDPVQAHRCICRTLPSAVSPQPAQLSSVQLDSTRLESRGVSASLQ